MSKFHCHVTFDVSTQINFDGDVEYALDTSEVEDFDDCSGFGGYGSEVEESGGEVTFTVEADDESDAEYMALRVVSDGAEVEDSSGITWTICNVSVDVEKVEEPMTLDRAQEILTQVAADSGNEEAEEAVTFTFDHIVSLTAKLARIEEMLRETQTALAEVKAQIAAQAA